MVPLPFRNRDDAAGQLAAALARFKGSNPVILAIPRGGVPMGRIIANALDGELDMVLVRKLGAPGHSEFAIGAVDESGNVMLGDYASQTGASNDYVRAEAQAQLALMRKRRASYRPGKLPVELKGRTVIVVDDGLATGSTMIAALQSARAKKPAYLVCAVPVAAGDSLARVSSLADDVVCLATPWPFNAVGRFYQDFNGVTDAEVVETFATIDAPTEKQSEASSESVRIPVEGVVLEGDLIIPGSPRGLVIFVHGSGSSRHSSRNRFVARVLNQRGFATLLFDLLTQAEDREAAARFDIALLARRLDATLQWVLTESVAKKLPIGLFGASTGAAAAIVVAAARQGQIRAVVSRGGRPDLAGALALSQIRTHTLLIVGGADTQVLSLNRDAQILMRDWAELTVVPGATHLFEESGTLEKAAVAASEWFARWLQDESPQLSFDMDQGRSQSRF
jgi:putative phosphoribosyl transferase